MSIDIVNGRPKSVRTQDETVEDILKQFDEMSDDEKAAFLAVVDGMENGEYEKIDSLIKVEYEIEPVDPMTFLLDDYYLGAVGNSMWPSLQDDFVELFEGDYCEAILSGSLGWGKSFFATCGLAYIIYQMSCLANPQQVYGLAPGSGLVIALLSATREAARRVPLNELASKIQLSPYFKERLPFKVAQTMYEIRFPTKKIMAVAGSTASAAIGTNVFSGFLDEMAFMGDSKHLDKSGRLIEVDKSEQLSKAIVRRMKSRFQRSGRLPGIMFLVSSKEKPVAFIERRIAEVAASGDSSVFIREYATWDVKPKENFSGETFMIAVGSDRVRSKIDPSTQEIDWYREQGLRVITVPEDYRRDFESDIEGCLDGDTKIALLDGTNVPIRDLVGRDEFWVYSYGSDGRLYPGRGYDARLTMKNENVLAVTIDNGCRIRCTANHLFMLRDGSYVRADQLVSGMSIMPLYRRMDRYGYEMVRSNVGGRWVHTHKIIDREAHHEGEKHPPGYVIHHRNFKRNDNSPSNLELMIGEEHRILHRENVKYMHTPDAIAKSAASRRVSLKARAAQLQGLEIARSKYVGTEKHRETARLNGKTYGFGDSTNGNILVMRSLNGTRNITALNLSDKNPTYKPENRKAASERLKKMDAYTRLIASYKGLHSRWCDGGLFEACDKCQKAILERHPDNHKVVSVTQGEKRDVYDISVDIWNNFALSDGIVVHNSLRDVAGIATETVSPFIHRVEKIESAVDNSLPRVLDADEMISGKTMEFMWERVATQIEVPLPGGYKEMAWRPKRHPNASRYAHIDPALSADSAGIAIAHISGWTEVVRRDGQGVEYSELAPVIETDFLLRVMPPPGDEIFLGDLRWIIYQFVEHGFMVSYVSMDRYQSADGLQQFRKHGMEAEVISVDKTPEPYEVLKSMFYEDRIHIHRSETLLRELVQLQRLPTSSSVARFKIDHPKKGCFVGETRIPLLDGTHPTMKELDGKSAWVYSAKPDGEIVPGKAIGKMTGFSNVFVDVILDNGAVERCTPEHLWMLRDGSYREAQHLRPGIDRLMPIKRVWPINGGYERISNKNGKRILTAHAVWSAINGKDVPDGCCIHHLNGIKTDNRPENLEASLFVDHAREHTRQRHCSNPEWRQKLYDGARRFNESPEGRSIHSEALKRTMAALTEEEYKERARKHSAYRSDITIDLVEKLKDDPDATNANVVARMLGCGRNVIVRVLHDMGFESWDEFQKAETGDNHKVREIIHVFIKDPVPVYDLEVEQYSNFSLSSGVFVHNSKDLGDALAGVAYALSRRLPGRPMAPMMAPRHSAASEQTDNGLWVTDGRVMVSSNSSGTQPPSRGTMDTRQPGKGPPMPFVRG